LLEHCAAVDSKIRLTARESFGSKSYSCFGVWRPWWGALLAYCLHFNAL